MKITELLKKKQKDKIILTALVHKETNELATLGASIMDESKYHKFEFELVSPTFEVISEALKSLYSSGGDVDTIKSGAVMFNACYTGNQGSLEEIREHSALYTSLCAKCAETVEIAHIEFKKK